MSHPALIIAIITVTMKSKVTAVILCCLAKAGILFDMEQRKRLNQLKIALCFRKLLPLSE